MFYELLLAFTLCLIIGCWAADHAGKQRRKTNDEIDQAIAIAMEYPDPKNQQ